MKIISLHCDYINFKPIKKALKKPEAKEVKEKKVKECLVVLTAVEKTDEQNKEAIAKKLVENIKDIAKHVKTKTIVLYPYVHLTSKPSSPETALWILKQAEKNLKSFKVVRAPFGWYKSFELKCKGHPLSELSREINIDKIEKTKDEIKVSEALRAEKKLKSDWYILDLKGKFHKLKIDKQITGFDFSKNPGLKKLASYEIKKVRTSPKESPHIKLMRKLELVDYEEASDPGNLRYYPKGRFIKALLEEVVTKKMQEYGALEVETPIMYDFEHPALKSYLNRFPARQYSITTPNKKVFLRFSACFGQFIMASQASISYKNLPLKLYEMTKYSFRVEQRGELSGLRRLRTFTMPDCHAFCQDLKQAKEEMKIRMMVSKKLQEEIGFDMKNDFELAIRVTKDFYNKNKIFIQSLVKNFGKPALVEIWPKQFFYFVAKYEFNFIDALDKASALTTDQIDIENAKRYKIQFTNKNNKREYPLILHLSPSGAIERIIYALLEKAAIEQRKGKYPILPFWLSPTQVRIIPISEKFINQANEIARDFNEVKPLIRTDVDDRPLHVEKRVLEAEQEWIPYIVCIGKRELDKQIFSVRERATGKIKQMKPKEFKKILLKAQGEMPWKPLPLPTLLSKRPKFL